MSDWKEAGGNSGDSWKPENVGDTIMGSYIGKKENVGLNNSTIYLVQVAGQDEPTSVWSSTVLDTKFQEIPVGSDVKIEYLGKEKGNAPMPYKNFKVLYKAGIDETVAKIFPDAKAI